MILILMIIMIILILIMWNDIINEMIIMCNVKW